MEEKQISLSQWDVFLAIAGHSSPASLSDLAKQLWQNDTAELEAHLNTLVSAKLIESGSAGYQSTHSAKAENLFEFLSFALAYDYDYNAYLHPDMQELLRRTFALNIFSEREIAGCPNVSALLYRLAHDCLIVFFNYHPLLARIVKSHFFDLLLDILEIKPARKLFSFKFNIDMSIMAKLLALQNKDLEQLSWGRKLLIGDTLQTPELILPKMQKLLKYDIVPDNPDIFDKEVQKNYDRAFAKMEMNVQRHKPISLEVIHDYHVIAMTNSGITSDLRTHEVEVRNNPYFKVAAPKTILPRLQAYMAEYEKRSPKAKRLIDALALAAYVYNEFLYIHPFEDGNTRTAMLTMAHVLTLHSAGFQRIPKSYDYRFLQVTKGAKKRNDNDLFDLLKEVYVAVLNQDELKKICSL